MVKFHCNDKSLMLTKTIKLLEEALKQNNKLQNNKLLITIENYESKLFIQKSDNDKKYNDLISEYEKKLNDQQENFNLRMAKCLVDEKSNEILTNLWGKNNNLFKWFI